MKTQILSMLREHHPEFISGEEMSQVLGVSRTAIWKNIKALKSEGYAIESVSNKGYRYIDSQNDLNAQELELAFKDSDFIERILYFDSLDSTNARAKQIGNEGNVKTTLIVADEQTVGRGRLGRQWSSQKNEGLWMSLLLSPNIRPELAARMTLIAAAAMNKAIIEVAQISTLIKWPNDIIYDQKKVCGILTELSAELNHINYLVLGIGVNVSQNNFPEDISDKATSLLKATGYKVNRLKLLKAFITHFEVYYKQLLETKDIKEVIAYNKMHSITLNKEVNIIAHDTVRTVEAVDIDPEGNLVIINEQNDKELIYYGEVSVRGINGYA